jgi:hypothetical protein
MDPDNSAFKYSRQFANFKLEYLIDPDNSAFKYSRQFANFKDGYPEEWIN